MHLQILATERGARPHPGNFHGDLLPSSSCGLLGCSGLRIWHLCRCSYCAGQACAECTEVSSCLPESSLPRKVKSFPFSLDWQVFAHPLLSPFATWGFPSLSTSAQHKKFRKSLGTLPTQTVNPSELLMRCTYGIVQAGTVGSVLSV